MSVTLDTNVLLYASNDASTRQPAARALLDRLAAGPSLVYLFWPVTIGYLRISTHPGVFDHPLDPQTARANIEDLLDRPHVRCPGEPDGFWAMFTDTTMNDVIRGNLVTDAHITALMRAHGVGTIYTADRDFKRFREITALDPFRAAEDT